MANQRPPFLLMAKPLGPICNLDCEYCYYLQKESLFPARHDFRITDETLERYVQQTLAASPGPRVDFAWQGGEPTLLGLDGFRRAVALQKQHLPPGWTCTNALQTNGTLLTDEWCAFLKAERFLVGISIDGPAELHDAYRVDKGRQATHARVMAGLRKLQEHGVDYNVLCVVNNHNAAHPLTVYRFLKQNGVAWIQFIPLVERMAAAGVTPRSVSAAAYGDFLTAIFDEWVRHDVGKCFIQMFEECLLVWSGARANLCIFQETCGRALVMEHNGDVFSCDHFVDPQCRLGNLHDTPLADLVSAPEQVRFGLDKRDALPGYCKRCDVRFMCNGGCPKDRFIVAPDGEPGLNYLCAGYKRLFTHVDPYMRRMVALWRRGLTPDAIMADVRAWADRRWNSARRNGLCPCGSGKKSRVCCLSRRRSAPK